MPDQQPNNGYLGYIFGYANGQLAISGAVARGVDRATCVREIKAAVAALKAQAPNGASVAGVCYEIPDAPPPIERAANNPEVPNGSKTL